VIAPSPWELAGEVRSAPAPPLEELAQRLGPADLVLVEGYKSAAIAKILVRLRAGPNGEDVTIGL
jgi:molybdopterin-guanine dinucleotide biosynthesis protein